MSCLTARHDDGEQKITEYMPTLNVVFIDISPSSKEGLQHSRLYQLNAISAIAFEGYYMAAVKSQV